MLWIYAHPSPCTIQFMFQVIKIKEIHIFEKCVSGSLSLKGDANLCEKGISLNNRIGHYEEQI